jgi:hypothetical protein
VIEELIAEIDTSAGNLTLRLDALDATMAPCVSAIDGIEHRLSKLAATTDQVSAMARETETRSVSNGRLIDSVAAAARDDLSAHAARSTANTERVAEAATNAERTASAARVAADAIVAAAAEITLDLAPKDKDGGKGADGAKGWWWCFFFFFFFFFLVCCPVLFFFF